jgi:hypothetical protein
MFGGLRATIQARLCAHQWVIGAYFIYAPIKPLHWRISGYLRQKIRMPKHLPADFLDRCEPNWPPFRMAVPSKILAPA